MTAVTVTTEARTVVVTEGDGKTTVVSSPSPAVLIETIGIGPQGPQGPEGPSGSLIGSPTFIQTTQPTSGQLNGATKYAWWDTSGGDLTLWIEDGI